MRRRQLLGLVSGGLLTSTWLRGSRLEAQPRRDADVARARPSEGGPDEPEATPSALTAVDLKLDGDPKLARRALVWVPTGLVPGERVAALILLHGKGETGNEVRGIHAWASDYGLLDAQRRLHQPPLQRVNPHERLVDPAWLERINLRLQMQPARQLVFICPVTPNPHGRREPLDAYAEWVEQVLLPGVSRAVPALCLPHNLGLAGCSLGGYVAMELYLRKPKLFSSLGLVQAAMGVWRARGYVQQLLALSRERRLAPLHVLSSTRDPFLGAAQALSRGLGEAQVFHELETLPGPHSQPWLREAGTLATIHWHDRILNGPRRIACSPVVASQLPHSG